MRSTWRSCVAVGVLTAALTGCPDGGGNGEEDSGTPPPDACNSQDEAFGAGCVLTLGGAPLLAYIGEPGDQDWYGIQLPGNLTARSLLHVSGGYGVPNTPVNLSFNILRADGSMSVARASDRHTGAPKPLDIIVPFGESNAKLVVQVSDDPINPMRPYGDPVSQYSLKAELVENPDVNEPNDSAADAKAIGTPPVGGVPTGQQTGYLATTDDVDKFTVAAPAGKILYLHITAPKVTPPAAFKLAYTLSDSTGKPVAEGRAESEALAVDIATARALPGGVYTLTLQAYRPLGVTGPLPGDLRLKYTIDVQFFDELDTNEANETAAAAKPLNPTLGGGPVSKTGRIGFVPDVDWFYADVPADGSPSVLRYRLTAAASGGRFAPLPGPSDRNVRVFSQVTTGVTQADKVVACKTDPLTCPKGYDGRNFLVTTVETACETNTPPLCLHSERNEAAVFPALRNFEGRQPIPPHAGTIRYLFLVQDSGNNWADDRVYTLEVELLPDADPIGTQTVALAQDTSGATFPVPPAGATTLTGELSHGYGRLIRNDPNNGQGVRAVDDYDAVPTDLDRFQVDFPAITPADKTWELQWQVGNGPDGGVVADLSLELEFCDGRDGGAGSCTPVTRGSRGNPLVLAYQPDSTATWYSADTSVRQIIYDRSSSGGITTVTTRANACACFEPRFVLGGKFFIKVGAVDRQSNQSVSYTVRTAYTDYPKTYAADGGARSCPVATDGGTACVFTREP